MDTHSFPRPHLVEAGHQVLHGVASLSIVGRGGRARQGGLEAGVTLGLTLSTPQIPGQETQVVQRKHLEEWGSDK